MFLYNDIKNSFAHIYVYLLVERFFFRENTKKDIHQAPTERERMNYAIIPSIESNLQSD